MSLHGIAPAGRADTASSRTAGRSRVYTIDQVMQPPLVGSNVKYGDLAAAAQGEEVGGVHVGLL